MFFNVQYSVIIFGALFSMIMAMSQLFRTDKTGQNYVIMGLFFCIGCIQLYHGLIFTDILVDYVIFKLLNISFIFFLGPLFYMYFHLLINMKNEINKSDFYYLIPGAFTLITILTINIIFRDKMFQLHQALRGDIFIDHFLVRLLIFLIVLSIFYFVFFFLLFIKKNLNLICPGSPESTVDYVINLFLLLFFFLAILGMSSGIILFVMRLVKFGVYRIILLNSAVFISTFPIIIFLLSQRHTRLLHEIEEVKNSEDREKDSGYKQSQLKSVDVDIVLNDLKEIMEDEKLFCDEDLDLKRLSAAVSVSPHQLSEILNERLGMNFYSYINEYRINEAIHMMIEEPERNLLSIGFAVGFNSKSAFYNAFNRITGKAPGNFRKTNE